jgi:PmbA protein
VIFHSETLTPAAAVEFVSGEARSRGADRFDIVAGESESMGLDLFEGKVKSTEISNSRGIGIRLFRGQRPGFSFSERFTRDALRRTVADAWSHTTLTGEVDLDLPHPVHLPQVDLQLFNPDLEAVSLEDMKTFGLRLEETALKIDTRVENAPYLGVSRDGGFSIICNSNGVFHQSRQNSISAGLGVVAKEGENRKMGVYSRGGRVFDFDAELMAGIAVERAVELLGGEPLPSGIYPVVFSNLVSPQLFSMFASPFFAEAAQKGQSRLQGKIGEAIATPEFNLASDPFIPLAPGSRLFDGEGVAARKVEVVRDGVLQTFLYNLESAGKAGVTPTGNGSRGYSGRVGTGFANYSVQKGGKTLEDLLAVHPRCMHVVKLEGGSGCSEVSGEISIGAQGFLCERGQRTRTVDRITLNTNFFDLLRNIHGFSNQYSDAFSSVKVPDVLVDEVHISG